MISFDEITAIDKTQERQQSQRADKTFSLFPEKHCLCTSASLTQRAIAGNADASSTALSQA